MAAKKRRTSRAGRTAKRKPASRASGRKRSAGKRRYGKAASKKVGRALHEAKRGQLRSGRSKKKVTSRKQAIAIGLAQARRRGAQVPPKQKSR